MTSCSLSCRRWFTVKGWAFSRVYSHFQQHLYCACVETVIYELSVRCKLRLRRSIRRPRFPIRVQNFSDLASFSVDFCILYAECPPYFYFRVVWPTDLESIPHSSTPTSIIPTRFEVDMTIKVTAFLSADMSRDLVTLTFWPWTDVIHGESCDEPYHQVWRSYACPFLSYELYNVSRWLPLKMRRITWPVSMGSKTITFLECSTPICLFIMQLRWLYDESN